MTTWNVLHQERPTWTDWNGATWAEIEATALQVSASGASTSSGSAAAGIPVYRPTASGASTSVGQATALLHFQGTATGSSTSSGSAGPYIEKYATASGASISLGATSGVLRRRVIPDAILVATNQTGVVGSVQDDPDLDDGSWLDATSRFSGSEVRVSFTDPNLELDGQQEFRVLLRAAD